MFIIFSKIVMCQLECFIVLLIYFLKGASYHMIQHTIWKIRFSIHDTRHDLTTMHLSTMTQSGQGNLPDVVVQDTVLFQILETWKNCWFYNCD